MMNLKVFFTQTKEVRLSRKTSDVQRILCSMVFIVLRELTIFSVKLSFRPGFVVVCQ